MNRWLCRLLACCLALFPLSLLALAGPTAAAPSSYSVTVLGERFFPLAISRNGNYISGSGSGMVVPFVGPVDGPFTNIHAAGRYAESVNDRGDTVGGFVTLPERPSPGLYVKGFSLINGVLSKFDAIGTGINNQGAFVRRQGYRLRPPEPLEVTSSVYLPEGRVLELGEVWLSGISDTGAVVGSQGPEPYPLPYAFQDTNGNGAVDPGEGFQLGLPPDGLRGDAVAVNDRGQAVGDYGTAALRFRPVLWPRLEAGVAPILLAPPTVSGQARALNHAGDVVGLAWDLAAPAGPRPFGFLYRDGQLLELTTLIPHTGDPNTDFIINDARGISDTGLIVAWGYHPAAPDVSLGLVLRPGNVPPASPKLHSLTVSPATLTLSASDPVSTTVTVSLTLPVLREVTLPLTLTRNGERVSHPGPFSVLLPAVKNYGSVDLAFPPETPPGEYQISARYGGVTRTATLTLQEAPPSPPATPTTLTATGKSPTQIDLAWQDNSPNETGFQVERKKGAEAYALVATPGAGATTYSDRTGLTANTSYTYRLRAYNAGGTSPYSNAATATTLPLPPTAPSLLTATAVSPTAIDLKWRDNSNSELGFEVERQSGAGSFGPLVTTAANATAYRDTSGLVEKTTYTYRLRAYNAGGRSSYSNEASATTLAYLLPAPSQLNATGKSAAQIELTWRDNSSNEQGFQLERKTGTGGFTRLATLAAGVIAYSDRTGLAANTPYTYRVRAYNGEGTSAYSNEASATTLPSPPAAPSALTATTKSATQIDLAWRDHSNNEQGFHLERKTGVTTFARIAALAVGTTSYRDRTGLAANTAYTYRVRAYNAGGTSAYSNEASTTTLPLPPAAPNGLTATVRSHTQLDLAWRDNSNNETGFQLERKTGTAAFISLTALAANATVYRDGSGLVANTLYTYRLRAVNAGGPSAYSNEAVATTLPLPPAAPSSLTATLVTDASVDLTWRDNSHNESGFRLERKVGSTAFALLTSPAAGVTRYRDSGLAPNTPYTYRLRAYNAGGESANSNEAAVTTPRKLGGTLVVTPTSVSFGPVKVKKTKQATVTLRNASATERLRVTVTPPAAPFGLPRPPGTVELGPGATAGVSISFRPPKAKKYRGKLGLSSSDPAHPTISVGLKGTGK